MKDSIVFALGALFSFPVSGYVSINRWDFWAALLFVTIVCLCGGICGLALKDYITKHRLKRIQ